MSSEHVYLKLSGKDKLIELHRLNCIFIHRLPYQVIIKEYKDADAEGYYSKVFVTDISVNRHFIETEKFGDHPVGICRNPENNSQVMANLTHVPAGSYRYQDGKEQGREYHGDTQRFPEHTPADVFKQPENNMQVFHPAVADGDGVGLYVSHENSYEL